MTFTISEENLPFNADRSIRQITLSNAQLTIVVHDFGARVHKILTPDKNGTFENILLSKDNSESYANDGGYYGVICGPVAGRIAGATYGSVRLEANEGKNSLHSGSRGWERQFWNYEMFQDEHSIGITFSLTDRQSGIPGSIEATVTYKLTDNKLEVFLTGLSGTDTIFNPAWHPYFNLSAGRSTTENHRLQVNTDFVVETNSENIPTGRLLNVDDTSYDLRESASIKDILAKNPTGFDDCFIFDKAAAEKKLVLYEPTSGRQLTATTDRQAVVIYTATNPETQSMIDGSPMSANRGIAIEFQEIPDLVHHPEWGDITLPAGQKKSYHSTFVFTAE